MPVGVARIGDAISHGGAITGGSPNTTADTLAVARLGDPVICDIHGDQIIVSASLVTLVDSLGVARLGDAISCGATIVTASEDVESN